MTAFVISPIGKLGTDDHKRYLNALKYIVKKALPESEWEVIRADNESNPDSISARIVQRIIESDLIIADLTDHNPNVFYELAVAHGFGQRVVHLLTAGQSIPFDVNDQRVIEYDLLDPESVDRAISELESSVNLVMNSDSPPRNPITSVGTFQAISSKEGEPVADLLSQVLDRLSRIEARVKASDAVGFRSPLKADSQIASTWLTSSLLHPSKASAGDREITPEEMNQRRALITDFLLARIAEASTSTKDEDES